MRSAPPFQLPVFFLKPGELFVGGPNQEPTSVKTVLGSCISLTLFHPRFKLSLMCHAMLPFCLEGDACLVRCRQPYKYVECVIPEMIARMRRWGVSLTELEAKLFGGADMFSINGRNPLSSVGGQNIEASLDLLKAEGIRLCVKDVGGHVGRKIYFYSHNGQVWLKHLN